MPIISLIVAMARGSRVIGLNGGMPWKLRYDLQNFKRLTTGHPIIMGRKTHESIGRALPNRKNIVLSRDPNYQAAEGCIVAPNLDAGLIESLGGLGSVLNKTPGNPDEVFIIGGEAVYREALPIADRLYVTLVDYDGEGDAFFPEYDEEQFEAEKAVVETFNPDEHNTHATSFWVFKRKMKA